jgi:predicted HTH domain antitoxin
VHSGYGGTNSKVTAPCAAPDRPSQICFTLSVVVMALRARSIAPSRRRLPAARSRRRSAAGLRGTDEIAHTGSSYWNGRSHGICSHDDVVMASRDRRSYALLMSAAARTVTVHVELPWATAGDAAPDPAVVGAELRLLWIVEQVRLHRVGVGKAAELANMPRAAFMRVLGEHGVPVIDYAPGDLEEELRHLGPA